MGSSEALGFPFRYIQLLHLFGHYRGTGKVSGYIKGGSAHVEERVNAQDHGIGPGHGTSCNNRQAHAVKD
jgi:hypothetical protein